MSVFIWLAGGGGGGATSEAVVFYDFFMPAMTDCKGSYDLVWDFLALMTAGLEI